VFMVTLAACYGVPSEPGPFCDDRTADRDADGFCGSFDCNESDPTIHAMAEDTVGDGIDQDCDGMDGMAPTDGGTTGM
jgi:hypothetical protein